MQINYSDQKYTPYGGLIVINQYSGIYLRSHCTYI